MQIIAVMQYMAKTEKISSRPTMKSSHGNTVVFAFTINNIRPQGALIK